jgi:hypothetical protein
MPRETIPTQASLLVFLLRQPRDERSRKHLGNAPAGIVSSAAFTFKSAFVRFAANDAEALVFGR